MTDLTFDTSNNIFNLIYLFTNQLRIKVNQVIDINTNTSSNNIKDNNNEQVLKKKHKSKNLYRSKETKNEHLETFTDTIKKQLFEPENIERVCS